MWTKRRPWIFSVFLSLALFLLAAPAKLQTRAVQASEPPRHSTGLTETVQWDNYTLWVNGQRIFLHSGEFHTFRLPVPDLWLDIFQKMAAAGLNGVSIYTHWGLTNPAPGVVDFDDWRALQPMFDAAKEAGIFIVLRPGPYINAETTAGGLALWSTSLVSSTLRTNATDFRVTWTQYVDSIIKMTVPNQISNGGPVIALQIDNEYTQNPIQRAEYFAELEAAYRAGGIVVPLTYNDPNQGKNFINGTGAVDIYGLDAYPQRFDCSHPTVWNPVTTNYHQYHAEVNPSQPWYMPEFQGGAFDPWGGPGYDACALLTGPEFEDVFYKQNWAANAKLLSYYMLYGGTSWGGIPFPGVYTSYDYGAAIQESRVLTPKYDELKRQGLFIRSSPDFRKTDWIGDSSTGIPGVSVDNSAAFVTYLKNPDSGAGFYILRQTNSTSTAKINFKVTVQTSNGTLTVPQTLPDGIELRGRQSKVVVTDYKFGNDHKLIYSTANVLFGGRIGDRDVLVLYGDKDQGTEFGYNHGIVSFPPGNFVGGIYNLFHPNKSTDPLIFYADTQTAGSFWAPVIASGDTKNPLASFWQFGSNATVLVGGPYLVRNATIKSSGELALRGDLNASTTLYVIGPTTLTSVSWNGVKVPVTIQQNTPGFLKGQISLTLPPLAMPFVGNWKYADSLPEIQPSFDDSHWIVANHTSTNITSKPLYGDGKVLYGCDYGFCENIILWRGHFNATGSEKSANLSINGGSSFAASVWINDKFINTTSGGQETNAVYTFPEDSVQTGKDNVITVVQDHMGNDEDPTEKSPRGIRGFSLNSGNFTTWRVQGKLGGYTGYPDKTRGLLNEGGLFGERAGWHLPGFDTSSWTSRSLSDGLPSGGAGIGFFVTTFSLNIPNGYDVPMSFVFDNVNQPYRALLFVNGWQFGKRVANLGPQYRFPVPEGILNYHGTNTVAVALWVLDNKPVSPSLSLTLDHIVSGGVGPISVNNPSWSKRF